MAYRQQGCELFEGLASMNAARSSKPLNACYQRPSCGQ
nr:MAG TPA: hypothetical protein [Caudoviricetes sp.]